METTLNSVRRFRAWALNNDWNDLELCCEKHSSILLKIMLMASECIQDPTEEQIDLARKIVMGRAGHDPIEIPAASPVVQTQPNSNPMQKFLSWVTATDFVALEVCCDRHKQILMRIVQQFMKNGITAKQLDFARDIVTGRASHNFKVKVRSDDIVSFKCRHTTLIINDEGDSTFEKCNTVYSGPVDQMLHQPFCPEHRVAKQF